MIVRSKGIDLDGARSVFYFYIDEGGIIGNCRVTILDKPLSVPEDEDLCNGDLSNYLFGLLPLSSIIRHLYMFNLLFPSTPIEIDEGSDIIYNIDEIIIAGEGGPG